MKLTLAAAARCMSAMAEEGFEEIAVRSVQTDSRTVEKGDLFFCISGEQFDGHEFAAKAAKAGACAVVVSRMIDDLDDFSVPVLMVRDTLVALGKLAACWRDICDAKLIAVTGTAGKTTVKEMLAAVCSQKYAVAKNYRNFNNQIGLPMSMLKASSKEKLWIMELGISHVGDMEELALIASPDVAVITNVGPGHLEGLGDEAGVAKAKTALLNALRENGTAIVSRDYPLLWDAATAIIDAPIGFSTASDAGTEFSATFLGTDDNGKHGRFSLTTPAGVTEIAAPFCGDHYAENLACVAAVAFQLGLTTDDIQAGLATLAPDTQRFCCKVGGEVTIIDDTYNANPLSMTRSIRTARAMAPEAPLVLVLADMRELGVEAKPRHVELGQLLREVKPAAVFYKGDHFKDVAEGYGDAMTPLDDADEFLTAWQKLGLNRGVVLFKGSRSLRMEAYSNALCRHIGAGAQGGNQ